MIAATMAVFYPKFVDIATKVHADNLFNLLLALSTLMLIKVSERQTRFKAKLMKRLDVFIIRTFEFRICFGFRYSDLEFL